MKKISLFISALVISISAALAQNATTSLTPEQKLVYANRIIESYYVDSIDSDNVVEEAIVAMLKTLDPHSIYSDAEETKELTTPLEGNFSGIGIQFNMLNDTLFVIQTTAGGPSEKVGLLPGDRILSAGDSILSGVKRPNSDILKILRGPKGTDVDITVLRRGVERPLQFRITRDDIPIYSVDAAFMADPTTGYVRITRFAEKTDEEFAEALGKLRAQGMKNLIIDLEDNGGGYLGAATKIAGHFLSQGSPIVYTEAPKLGTATYKADRNGDFRDGKVVVLVNQYSASASEILSGAIQDNDRGLIVGRRTFGKGLVQRPFPFPDGSMIRLTISRYYTPSGRCIQKPYDAGDFDDYSRDMLHRYETGEFSSADSIHFDSALRYETLNRHRTVYGGGGIMPDLFVPIDTTAYSDYYRDLMAKGLINRFAISYVDDHRSQLKSEYPTEESFISGFSVTDAMMQQLVELGTKDGIKFNEEQYHTSESMIRTIIKGIIGRDMFETSTYIRIVYPVLNPIYIKGLELINDTKSYNELLKGN